MYQSVLWPANAGPAGTGRCGPARGGSDPAM